MLLFSSFNFTLDLFYRTTIIYNTCVPDIYFYPIEQFFENMKINHKLLKLYRILGLNLYYLPGFDEISFCASTSLVSLEAAGFFVGVFICDLQITFVCHSKWTLHSDSCHRLNGLKLLVFNIWKYFQKLLF